jgi:hypothetical protein
LALELQHRHDPVNADLFIAVCAPEGTCRFFPNGEDYAIPFRSAVELSEVHPSLHFVAHCQGEWLRPHADYEVCAALFERESNPNLLSNCYWSAIKPFANTSPS